MPSKGHLNASFASKKMVLKLFFFLPLPFNPSFFFVSSLSELFCFKLSLGLGNIFPLFESRRTRPMDAGPHRRLRHVRQYPDFVF